MRVWCLQAQRSKFWVPYYIMLKWFFALLIGVGECLPHDLFARNFVVCQRLEKALSGDFRCVQVGYALFGRRSL